MSAIAQSPTVSRPTTITAATVLLALMGALGIVIGPLGPEGFDIVFAAIAFGIGTLRLVAAYGVWQFRRWAAILGFVVSLIDTLLSAPGLAFAPDALWRVLALIGVAVGIATLVLLVLPASRHAYA